ncbi:N-acetyltransferase family protein [Anaeroselena agilis]|uniref:GNAT family N-acetyltransferase n=1 Tax=Anaeroselena agilis TaxID=3063788 RepID=A0ABU3NT56_9FIRM|nr:GNAT family N-acetyltransferase [Selenomonadales bacterium 4137-cl]
MAAHFEQMTDRHEKEVMDIFNYYIENSYAAYPEQPLPYGFFGKFLEMTKGYPAKVISTGADGKIIGFCFLRAYNPLPVFRETAEVSYFIAKEEVGKSIGREALKILEAEGKQMGINNFLASISSLNRQSIEFHKKNGFVERGRLINVGRKKGILFDVVWMEKELG